MSNPDDKYFWYLAFTDAESFQTVSTFLAERGELAGNVDQAFLCPDGQKRQVITVRYVAAQEVKGMTVSYSDAPLKYRVMRREKPDGKIEWYRKPATKKDENPADKVTTGTALLQKLQKKRKSVPVHTPPEEVLDLPGAE